MKGGGFYGVICSGTGILRRVCGLDDVVVGDCVENLRSWYIIGAGSCGKSVILLAVLARAENEKTGGSLSMKVGQR